MGAMKISCPMKSTLVWSKIFMAIKDVFMGHQLNHVIFHGIFMGMKDCSWVMN